MIQYDNDLKERMSYVYAFLFFLSIANGLTFMADYIAIGKTYSYRATCDITRRAGFEIGKGWTCTENHRNMCKCFKQWKKDNNHPKSCKLARTFPMKVYHVHRWLQYLFNPTWHHPYLDIEKIESGTD